MKRLAIISLAFMMIAVSPAMAQTDNTTVDENDFSNVTLPNPDAGVLEFEPDSPLRPVETTKDEVSMAVGLDSESRVTAERSSEAVEELDENKTGNAVELMEEVDRRSSNIPEDVANNSENAENMKAVAKGLQQAQKNLEEKANRTQTIDFLNENAEDSEYTVGDNINATNQTFKLGENQTEGTVTLDIPPKTVKSVEVTYSDVVEETENVTVNETTNETEEVTYSNSVTFTTVDTRAGADERTEVGQITASDESPVTLTTGENTSAVGTEMELTLQRDEEVTTPVVESITVNVKQFDIPAPVMKGVDNAVAKANAKANGKKPESLPNPNNGSLTDVKKDMKEKGKEIGNIGKPDNKGRQSGGNGNAPR